MKRTAMALAVTGLLMSASALAPASAQAAECKAPVTTIGHGQAIEIQRYDFGVAYARLKARVKWLAQVTRTDGIRFANLYHAKNVLYSEDRGAGQIYIKLTATPCR